MNILEMFTNIISLGLSLFSILILFTSLYYTLIGFKGFGKAKRDYNIREDKSKFLILVAAHNEENVIASTIENLKKIDYDKNLYDLYIVNDNSTDRTEDECKKMGVNYINTNGGLFPREGIGKAGGLQYALRFLGFEYIKSKYDLVMILDADNHVSTNILKEINSQWLEKGTPTVIQTYLDSKNYNKTLSLGYTSGYIITNRFFQFAKYKLNLPSSIGGTGFVVRSDYLIESGGFNYKSLTEDLEMQIEIVNLGGRILWNHFARVYDEKPDDLKVSMKQRTRWMQGHWFVAFNNFKPLITKFFRTFKWVYMDQLIYLFGGAKILQMLFMSIFFVVSLIFLLLGVKDISFISDYSLENFKFSSIVTILYFLNIFYQRFIVPIYAFKEDTDIEFNFFKILISSMYYAYTFMICQIVGLFKWKQQNVWIKTEHKFQKRTNNNSKKKQK